MNNDTANGRNRFMMANAIYLTALGIIGCLSIGTYVLNDSIAQRQRDTARVVNIAGRQRMLSQRIAMLALDISRQDNMQRHGELEIMVKRYADEIESGNNLLKYGSEEKTVSQRNTLADYGVTNAEHATIDEHIRTYFQEARLLLDTPVNQRVRSPHLELLLSQARGPLLSDLDATVTRIQEHSEASVAFLRRVMLGTVALIIATLFAEALFIFRPLFKKLKTAQDALLEAATTDPLTGSMNRRWLMDAARFEFARSRRYNQPFSTIILDIDEFKTINDTWGHSTGDEAITALAKIISTTIRSSDLFGRLGGDEFAVILPQTNI
ncbi:MAG: diguanylate cyclase, partial [Humidesulfovibrio sp.]|nr:diguanylate cyclase [Humidesulfovibrio sp.]